MYGLAVTVQDSATPSLRRLRSSLQSKTLRPIIGRAGVNVVRKHLFARDRQRPNQLGGKRTHFYSKAARSTNYRAAVSGVVVSINHAGIAQRYFGGTIKPVKAKLLAIPARAEAHGKRPREFNDLEPAFGRNGIYGLQQRRHTKLRKTRKGRFAKGRKAGGGIYFWLVESVTQSPDREVLPSDATLGRSVGGAVASYINRAIDRERQRAAK